VNVVDMKQLKSVMCVVCSAMVTACSVRNISVKTVLRLIV